MNVSLFTLTVARGAELPAIDPSVAQSGTPLVVDTQNNGPAALAEPVPLASNPIAQSDHASNDGTAPK